MGRLLAIITAAILLAGWLGDAWAQMPRWRAIPGAPGIQYAPDLNRDVFRYREECYFFDGSRWHRGRTYQGPWEQIAEPPPVFYQVEPQYFKRPPGWDRGRKTGWGPYDMPPGQAKKFYGTGPPGHFKKHKPMPPGHMKKWGH